MIDYQNLTFEFLNFIYGDVGDVEFKVCLNEWFCDLVRRTMQMDIMFKFLNFDPNLMQNNKLRYESQHAVKYITSKLKLFTNAS